MSAITARLFITESFNTNFLLPAELETIITAMELFAKGKCKEQRELCSHCLTADIPLGSTHNLILQAPEPIV